MGGVIITVVVVALFSRLLARTDELQRHIYIDGAAIGLLMALPVAMGYALFERWLPALRAVGHDGAAGALVGGLADRSVPVPVGRDAMRNTLRVLRAERRWSQSDLAQRLGVSRQTVNAIETGRYDPSLPLAFAIGRLFDQPIERIFDADGENS